MDKMSPAEAIMSAKQSIEDRLETLLEWLEQHSTDLHPDDVTWADVSDLAVVEEALGRLVDGFPEFKS